MNFVVDAAEFLHEAFIDLQTARGIQNQDIVMFFQGFFLGLDGDIHRIDLVPKREEIRTRFANDSL